MNRRQALKAALSAATAAAALRGHHVTAQTPAGSSVASATSTFHVHPEKGVDGNAGSKDSPLRTLGEAMRRVNESTASGAMTIVLSEGVHAVTETLVLKPERRMFTKAERLTIRAEVLPDDAEWHIGRMPTLIHTMPIPATWNGRPDALGGAANGMLVETNHVTVKGLKILGLPVVETPQTGLKRRLYAIARLRQDLDDLEVAQCLFASDQLIASLHVGIIAHGTNIVVHHCVFRGYTKDAVVFWTPGSTGNAMRNCLFDGMYSSTVWTAETASDFDYRNNVVTGANYVWIYQAGSSARANVGAGGQLPGGATTAPLQPNHYKVVNSYFAGNKKLTGTGVGARVEFADIDASFLELSGTKVVAEPVVLGHDSTSRDYLHPVAGSAAAAIGAGLFTKPVG